MELLLILGYVVLPTLAIGASFAFTGDAQSPMGDGMILGLLILAVAVWPITMSFWLFYVVTRHRDAAA